MNEKYKDLEFSKPADRLLEIIQQDLTRTGKPVDRKTLLKIANQILESRI